MTKKLDLWPSQAKVSCFPWGLSKKLKIETLLEYGWAEVWVIISETLWFGQHVLDWSSVNKDSITESKVHPAIETRFYCVLSTTKILFVTMIWDQVRRWVWISKHTSLRSCRIKSKKVSKNHTTRGLLFTLRSRCHWTKAHLCINHLWTRYESFINKHLSTQTSTIW